MTTKKHAQKQHAAQARTRSKQTGRTRHADASHAPRVTWLQGARLRTLPLAIAPVILGSAVAAVTDSFNAVLALLCLLLALSLQVGVNFANDFSDGVRGTDAHRVGPGRLTGSGSATPARVRAVAFAFFALAALDGLVITLLTQIWWLPAVGVVAILAAWFYTGGKRPYGYSGFGELFVFVFFGLVATIGTAYVQSHSFTLEALAAGVGSGLLACAVLMVNNIRDIKQDAISRKRTLAVKVGQRWAKILFAILILVPYPILFFVNLLYPAVLPAWFTLLIVVPVVLIVSTAREAKELILALKLTSYSALAFALCVGWGLYRISSPL